MRCLGAFFLMCCCAVAGAVAINVDPQLPGQAVAAGASGVGWVTGALSRLGDNPTPHPAAPTPLAPNTAPVTLVPMPSAPLPPPAAAPTPPSTPAPSPTWTLSWSSQDRIWALATLQWDERLDTRAESTYPQFRAYYAAWVADWDACIADLQSFEAGVAPSATQRNDPPKWFATAIAAHQADAQAHPGSAGWDNEWISQYRRLISLWSEL